MPVACQGKGTHAAKQLYGNRTLDHIGLENCTADDGSYNSHLNPRAAIFTPKRKCSVEDSGTMLGEGQPMICRRLDLEATNLRPKSKYNFEEDDVDWDRLG